MLFVVPVLMAVKLIGVSLPLLGWITALLDTSDPADTSDNFHLPMDISESKADDVSKWLGDGVPIPLLQAVD